MELPAIQTIEALEALYDDAVPNAVTKVATSMTPAYAEWIEASKFTVLTTVGPEGTDASPRGDRETVVEILDAKTLLLPDWRGNNRIDSLRNIVRDGRASLMFMVPGCNNVVRVNGQAVLTADEAICARFERQGSTPKTVIALTIGEMYFQCAKALMRSELWGDVPKPKIPTAGDFIKEFKAGFDGKAYDDGYKDYAATRFW